MSVRAWGFAALCFTAALADLVLVLSLGPADAAPAPAGMVWSATLP